MLTKTLLGGIYHLASLVKCSPTISEIFLIKDLDSIDSSLGSYGAFDSQNFKIALDKTYKYRTTGCAVHYLVVDALDKEFCTVLSLICLCTGQDNVKLIEIPFTLFNVWFTLRIIH